MTKIATFIHGLYPRSERLVSVSRDFDRGRKTARELQKEQKRDLDNLIRLQKSLGFDFLEDGKFSWQDIFRPIVASTDGLAVGALTRWFDNNTFFRQPRFTGKLTLSKKRLLPFFPKITPARKWKVTLPSPYTFARLCQNETSFSFEQILDKITFLIGSIIDALEDEGVSLVQLNEPYLPYHGANKKEIRLLLKEIAKLTKPKRQLKLTIHFYFGDAAPILSAFNDKLGLSAAGVDFYKTNLADLPRGIPYDLIAGVVDGRNSLIENATVIREFVRKIEKYASPPVIYLSNNSDLELVPESIARKKLEILAKVKKQSIL